MKYHELTENLLNIKLPKHSASFWQVVQMPSEEIDRCVRQWLEEKAKQFSYDPLVTRQILGIAPNLEEELKNHIKDSGYKISEEGLDEFVRIITAFVRERKEDL